MMNHEDAPLRQLGRGRRINRNPDIIFYMPLQAETVTICSKLQRDTDEAAAVTVLLYEPGPPRTCSEPLNMNLL